MLEGWIRLHRKIQECEIWSNNQPFDMRSAWVDLLLLANHRDVEMIFDYEPLIVERGQFLTSVRKLSQRWSWSKDRTLKFLRLLESLQMIHRDSNGKRTLITIDNYDVYQADQDTDTDTDKDTTSDTPSDAERTQNGHSFATNKNEKNDKNEKDICIKERNIIPPTLEMVRAYCESRNNKVNPETFCDFYTSKGWMVGKEKMKDWQASIRTWEKDDRGKSAVKASPNPKDNPKIHNYEERKNDFDALMKIATGE